MRFEFQNVARESVFQLLDGEPEWDQRYDRDLPENRITIAWNKGPDQQVTIDGIQYSFPD